MRVIKKAVAKVKYGNAIGFMPFDTNDGLTEIDRNEHFSYVLGLFKTLLFSKLEILPWQMLFLVKKQQIMKNGFKNFKVRLTIFLV